MIGRPENTQAEGDTTEATGHRRLEKRGGSKLFTARATVSAGFIGLLLLMATMALDSARSLQTVSASSAASRKQTRERDALLDELRTDIYHSSTVVRDYLLDADETRAAVQKAELELAHQQIEATLKQYEAKTPASEKQAFLELRSRVASYWESLAPVLLWSSPTRRDEGAEYLRTTILPQRAEVVQVVALVTQMNQRDVDEGEMQLQSMQAHFQQRVTVISIFALLLGVILAAVIIRRLYRVEKEAEERYREVTEARRELRKLSDRLVAAQEEERRNLARDLHDEIGQGISAMLVELGRLESGSLNESAQRERLALVRRMAESIVASVRNIALLLRPSMLDDLGLVPALRWQAREVARRTGLKVRMIAEEIADDLPDACRTCLYRFVQEALNNCARHAQATEVRVIVRQDPEGISVFVQDDGIGFDPARDKGMGLLGMEERVSRLGGLFHIESHLGQGSVLSMRFRVEAASAMKEQVS